MNIPPELPQSILEWIGANDVIRYLAITGALEITRRLLAAARVSMDGRIRAITQEKYDVFHKN